MPQVTTERWIRIEWLDCFVMLAEEWLEKEEPRFLDGI